MKGKARYWLSLTLLALVIQFVLFESFERFLYGFEMHYAKANPMLLSDDPLEGTEEATTEVDYDPLGFRTFGIDYAHKHGKRIIFIGANSIGMGYGVQASHSFPAFFGKTLNQLRPNTSIEIINLNLPGNPLPKNMALLKDIFFEPIQPDIVIYGEYLYQTDLFFPALGKETVLDNVFGGGDINFATGLETGNPQVTTQAFLEHSKLWTYLVDHSLLMAKFLGYLDVQLAKAIQVIHPQRVLEQRAHQRAGYLSQLHAFLKDQGIPLLIVSLPNTQKNVLHQAIYDVAVAEGIPYLPLDAKRDAGDYTYVENGHYSAQTNALLGAEIAMWFDSVMDNALQIKPNYSY